MERATVESIPTLLLLAEWVAMRSVTRYCTQPSNLLCVVRIWPNCVVQGVRGDVRFHAGYSGPRK